MSGFGGTFGEIIANQVTDYPTVVTIAPTDRGFDSSGCGTWTTDLSPITAAATTPFTNGLFIVGTDIAAGICSAPGGASCYWARLSGFSGEFKDIVANGVPSGTTVVTIATTDRGFKADGCGTWTKIGYEKRWTWKGPPRVERENLRIAAMLAESSPPPAPGIGQRIGAALRGER